MIESGITRAEVYPELRDADINTLRSNRRYWERVCEAPSSPRRLHRALFELAWIRIALHERGDYGLSTTWRNPTGRRCALKIG